MAAVSSRPWFKPTLLLAAAVLVTASAQWRNSLNRMRADPSLGLTRLAPLENAPPVLAFTTVALGGFRGLIANVLWVRATDLQLEGKYFEMVQLADWITKLEPHFSQVWIVQAWNMAYNISVKFSSPADRWRWVKSGIQLLRDDGLRFNPRDALIYRELAWFFQHKIGQELDDANVYYKFQWAKEMTTNVLGGDTLRLERYFNPQTDEDRTLLRRMREIYKMEPEMIRAVEERYGPLDWRLPEASAIYWAYVGLQRSTEKDKVTLRRVIYQSMLILTLRGRMRFVETEGGEAIRFAPNLELADRANGGYLQMIAEEPNLKGSIETAHKNYLRELVFQMYSHNRLAEARRWLDYLRETYPDALPAELTLEEYALRRLAANIRTMNHNQSRLMIESFIQQSFVSRAVGEDELAEGYLLKARQMWEYYSSRVGDQNQRLQIEPLERTIVAVRDRLLAPGGLDAMLQARLRTRLGIAAPAE